MTISIFWIIVLMMASLMLPETIESVDPTPKWVARSMYQSGYIDVNDGQCAPQI